MPEKRATGVPETPFSEPPQRRGRTPEALEHDLTTAGYEYLQARGISDEVIDASGVRWVRTGTADGTDTAADYGFPQRSFGLFFRTRPLPGARRPQPGHPAAVRRRRRFAQVRQPEGRGSAPIHATRLRSRPAGGP